MDKKRYLRDVTLQSCNFKMVKLDYLTDFPKISKMAKLDIFD